MVLRSKLAVLREYRRVSRMLMKAIKADPLAYSTAGLQGALQGLGWALDDCAQAPSKCYPVPARKRASAKKR